jgi:hypothetical protein
MAFLEEERDSILLVHAHAERSRAVALQPLETIARRKPEIVERACR